MFGMVSRCFLNYVRSSDAIIGNSTYSAITAIIAANVVLVAYIILSLLEDRENQKSSVLSSSAKETEDRKER